jgi:surface carbohydrate biosynthesis protein|tara:strand:- start:604 stop:1728 length:1125 start_codon:yes stop_codon:yes gene_type:complete
MLLQKNLIIFFKYFLKAKWVIKLPKKNKFVLVDSESNPFLKYIKKKDFTILHRRGEEINFSILLKCLLKLRFTTLDYCAEFIRHVSPKLILTAFDYHTIFYKLSKKTGIKTLMLQKGKRAYTEGLYPDRHFYFPKNSKKGFFVDYSLVYNSAVKNFYSKRIGGKFFEIGSLENNLTKPNLKTQKKEIIFVSNFSLKNSNKSEYEDIVAFHLNKLAVKNKIKFNILPRFRNRSLKKLNKEKSFYNKILKNKVSFITNKDKTSYDLLLKYKYVFATYSTIAQECLVKGIRVGFVMLKSQKNPYYGARFGLFEKLKSNGLFWTCSNKLNISEIVRVFNFVTKTKYVKWLDKTNPYYKLIMKFDYKNKIFNKILKEIY